MTYKEIEIILGRFYDGDTTLAEERELVDFFSREDIPEYLQVHQPYFRMIAGERAEGISPEFGARLDEALNAAAIEEVPVRKLPVRRFIYRAGIAASVLLLAGLAFTFRSAFFNSQGDSPDVARELAYAETREALNIVSSKLNVGLRQVVHLEKLDRTMDNLNKLNAFHQCQTLIINPAVPVSGTHKQKQP